MYLKVSLLILLAAALTSNPLYAKKNKDKTLPPGLQKKVDRGGSLPPGWQKKLHKGDVLDSEVYRHGRVVIPVNHEGILTINVDGKIIKLMEKTREIIDILR